MKKLIFKILENFLLNPDKTIILLNKVIDLTVTNITFRSINTDKIIKKITNMHTILSCFYNLSKSYYISAYFNLINLLPRLSFYVGELDNDFMLKIKDIDNSNDNQLKIKKIQSINDELYLTCKVMENKLSEISTINLNFPLILKSLYFNRSYDNLNKFLIYTQLSMSSQKTRLKKVADKSLSSLDNKNEIDDFINKYNINTDIPDTFCIIDSEHKHFYLELNICSEKQQLDFIQDLINSKTKEENLFVKPDYLDCSIIKILKNIWDNPANVENKSSSEGQSNKESIKTIILKYIEDSLAKKDEKYFDEKDLIISGHGINGCLALIFCLDKDIHTLFCESGISFKTKNIITYGMPPFMSKDFFKNKKEEDTPSSPNHLLELNNIRLFQFSLPTDWLSFFTINDKLIFCQREVIILATPNKVDKFSDFYMKKIDIETILQSPNLLIKKKEGISNELYLLELNKFTYYFQIINQFYEQFKIDKNTINKKDIYFYNDITLCNFDFKQEE